MKTMLLRYAYSGRFQLVLSCCTLLKNGKTIKENNGDKIESTWYIPSQIWKGCLFVWKWYQNMSVQENQEEENQDQNQDKEKDTFVCLKYINRIHSLIVKFRYSMFSLIVKSILSK